MFSSLFSKKLFFQKNHLIEIQIYTLIISQLITENQIEQLFQ